MEGDGRVRYLVLDEEPDKLVEKHVEIVRTGQVVGLGDDPVVGQADRLQLARGSRQLRSLDGTPPTWKLGGPQSTIVVNRWSSWERPMPMKQTWHVRVRLTTGNLKVLRAGDGQLLSQIKAELAAGREIWIRGHVSLVDSGLRLCGTGSRDIFRGRSLFVNTDRRSLFQGDRGPFTSNVILVVKGTQLRLQMSRRGVRDLLEAAARPKRRGALGHLAPLRHG
jgi:hypothetical protein